MAEMKPPGSLSRRGENQKRSGEETDRAGSTRAIDSTALLGKSGRVVIEHRGQRYELRETRFGKLILTK